MATTKRSTTLTAGSNRPITQVALYARVSTLNNQDPEMQLAELREYAERRDWQIVEEFTDQGVSGCKESRSALNRLMSGACRRRFDAILVWKIDRWGRSLKDLVTSLAELDAYRIGFVRVRDNLDLSTPSGRLMMQLLGAMAEFERAIDWRNVGMSLIGQVVSDNWLRQLTLTGSQMLTQLLGADHPSHSYDLSALDHHNRLRARCFCGTFSPRVARSAALDPCPPPTPHPATTP
jgi:hypothetical protein